MLKGIDNFFTLIFKALKWIIGLGIIFAVVTMVGYMN